MIADRNPGVDWALYSLFGQMRVSTRVQVALEPYVPVHSIVCQNSVNQTQSIISLINSNLLVAGPYILVANDTFGGQRSVSFNISIAGIVDQCLYIV